MGPDGGELGEYAGHMSVALAHLSSASSDVSVLLEQVGQGWGWDHGRGWAQGRGQGPGRG